MTTRRSRIKGIANIPQRRKIEHTPIIDESHTGTNEPLIADVKETAALRKEELTNVADNSVISSLSNFDEYNSTVESVPKPNDESQSKPDPTYKLVEQPASRKSGDELNDTHVSNDLNVNRLPIKKSELIKNSRNDHQTSVKIPHRRTFIKPLVNLKSLSQKSKPKVNETDSTPNSTIAQITTVDDKETEIICNPDPCSSTAITPSISTIDSLAAINSNSESESTEPQSPTKLLNRSRIKAVPRLHQRRISSTIHGSASESEDDTKKSFKRVKADSISSTTSTSLEHQDKKCDPDVPQKNKDFNSVIQRKCKRTEQSYKMAEARRNFITKFRNETPDKHKLTMLDLIFYNPSTKPMSQKSEKSEEKKIYTVKSDSPLSYDSPEQNIESDEDNVIPAPQIKIGSNGEIVVDEQSLIIENKQTKKDRENLQKSELVDGDFDTGYGIYKRAKRSRDWSKDETLFFYKALNTLGTDFSIMTQLFPERTRRELKLKFKKEEKINNALVDKALTRPLQFNIRELKEEVENRKKRKEREEIEKELRLKELKLERKSVALPYIQKGFKRPRKRDKRTKKKPKHEDIYTSLEKGISSVWESDSEDEEESEKYGTDEASTESPLTNILKPTRSGRVPKQNQNFNLGNPKLIKSDDETVQEPKHLEPGSLMVVSCQTATGLPTFKVFIVTSAQTKVPIVLSPDVINNLTQNIPNSTVEAPIPENNYTICHDASESGNTENSVETNSDINLNTSVVLS